MTAYLMDEKTLTRTRWWVLAVVTVVQVTAAFAIQGLSALTGTVHDAFRLSGVEIGLMVTAVGMAPVLSLFIVGDLVDRRGERWVLAGGSGIMTLGLVGAALAPAYAVMLAFLLLAGIGYSTVQPGGSKSISVWFPPERRGVAMGIRQAGQPIGGAAAAAVLPLTAHTLGWRAAFACAALTALAGGAAFTLGYRHHPQPPSPVANTRLPTTNQPPVTTTPTVGPVVTTTPAGGPSVTKTPTDGPATTARTDESIAVTTTAGGPVVTTTSADEPATTAAPADGPVAITLSADGPVAEAVSVDESVGATALAGGPSVTTTSVDGPVVTTTSAGGPGTPTVPADEAVVAAVPAGESVAAAVSVDESVGAVVSVDESVGASALVGGPFVTTTSVDGSVVATDLVGGGHRSPSGQGDSGGERRRGRGGGRVALRAGDGTAAAGDGSTARSAGGVVRDGNGRKPGAALVSRLTSTLRQSWMRSILWSGVPLVGLQFGLTAYLMLFARERYHLPLSRGALLLGLLQVAGVVGRVGLAAWTDRPGRSRMSAVRLCMVATAAMLTVVSLLPASTPGAWLVAAVLALGFFGVGWYGPWIAHIVDVSPPEAVGKSLGAAMAANQVAIVTVPPALGLLHDTSGSYEAGWWLFAGVIAVCALVSRPS